MPYPEENEERQGHENEFQLESILLEVCVPPNVVQQADPTPPGKYQGINFIKILLGKNTDTTSLQIYLFGGILL